MRSIRAEKTAGSNRVTPKANAHSQRTLAWAPPLLFLLCTLLLLVAMWSPWGFGSLPPASDRVPSTGADALRTALVTWGMGQATPEALASVLWDALPLCGLVLFTEYLIRRPGRLGKALLGLWVLLTTAVSALALYGQFALGGVRPGRGLLQPTDWRPALGAELAIVALPLLGVSLTVLFLTEGRTGADGAMRSTLPSPSLAPNGTARALFTVGVLAWAVGVFAMPWATAGCVAPQQTLLPIATSRCLGIDGLSALNYGIASSILAGTGRWFPSSVQLLELFTTGGALSLYHWWRSRNIHATQIVTVIWLLLAGSGAALAVSGVRLFLPYPPAVKYGPAFSLGQGVSVAIGGLALCTLSVVVAYIAAWLALRKSAGGVTP